MQRYFIPLWAPVRPEYPRHLRLHNECFIYLNQFYLIYTNFVSNIGFTLSQHYLPYHFFIRCNSSSLRRNIKKVWKKKFYKLWKTSKKKWLNDTWIIGDSLMIYVSNFRWYWSEHIKLNLCVTICCGALDSFDHILNWSE